MSDGLIEEKKDLSAEVALQIPLSTTLSATPSGLSSAIDLLMTLEKKCRVGNDLDSLKLVVVHAVKLCFELKEWEKMIDTFTFISKRRSQKNGAISAIVSEGMQYIPLILDESDKEKFVVCLKDITMGKIYVEAELSRLTQQLSQMKEKQGLVTEACDILQEVHVETYGSLSKLEKVEFILEQIRLVLLKKDMIRAYIVSQKIQKKVFEEEAFYDLKVRFYTLMGEYYRHTKSEFDICNGYFNIYLTPSIQSDEVKRNAALKATVLFLVLSPYSNEQTDLLHRLNNDANIELLPNFHSILKNFTTPEIVPYPFQYMDELLSLPEIKEGGSDLEAYWNATIHTRVIQHNIRIISKYYTRITTPRLSALLNLTNVQLEQQISEMVSNGEIYAKIDRPAGVVRFEKGKSKEEVLSAWGGDVSRLLSLVEGTTHMIHKEMMTK